MVDDVVRGRPRERRAALEVVLVGAGERARAWLEPLRRSPRIELVATVVARGEARLAGELPAHAGLSQAMDAHPNALFAIPLPPRSALEGALSLARAGRAGVVEAPLHASLCDAELGPGADRVRVAHGWVTLPGRAIVDKLVRRVGSGRLFVDIAGLPECAAGETAEAVVHGLALVRSLLPRASVEGARFFAGGIAVDLACTSEGGDWTVEMKLRPRGRRVSVRVESGTEPLLWSWENGREAVTLGATPVVATRAVASGEVRALAQMVGEPRGDTLADAARVMCLQKEVEARLGVCMPPNARRLRQSASIGERRPTDLLARLGLRGEAGPGEVLDAEVLDAEVLDAEVPDAGVASDSVTAEVDGGVGGHVVPAELELTLPPEPFELWAFRAGVKPVAFLTVPADAVERTVGYFGDVHCERRERLVSIAAQDRWDDRRDCGDARVELYLSRDADLARRAAYLQAEVDPTAAIREIGELVGYPGCCVEAFAAQADRSNNSFNRYHSWSRTERSNAGDRWPWELNNLHTMIAPFYPCSYRCSDALGWARAALAEMAAVHPAMVERLRQALLQPVLYFDHDHQLILQPTARGVTNSESVDYRAAAVRAGAPPAFARFAGAVCAGNRLSLDDTSLTIARDGAVVARFIRTDPALGFIAPFVG